MLKNNIGLLICCLLLITACTKQELLQPQNEEDNPEEENNNWATFFNIENPETCIYISSLAIYDDETIIFSKHAFSHDYIDNTPLLYIVRKDSLMPIDNNDFSLMLPDLEQVYKDSVKSIWCSNNCIVRYDPNTRPNRNWTVGNTNKKRSEKIIQDKQGVIWEASDNGLTKYENGKSSQVFSGMFGEICLDNENNLYVSTLPQNLDERGVVLKYDYEIWDTIITIDNAYFWVSSMGFDSFNNLWFGVLYRPNIGIEYGWGLTKFEDSQFTSYTVQNSELTSNSVVEVCVDNDDNIWIGTYSGGICKYDNMGEWHNYSLNNTYSQYQSYEYIIIDKDTNIWASLKSAGLVKFKE